MIQRRQFSMFADLYRVGEELGSGKFAIVKRCVQVKNNQDGEEMAAKFIRKSRSARIGQKVEDIELEIEILSNLQHAHIINLLDVFEDNQQVILVFELMKGGELQDYIADCERLSEAETIHIVRQILLALVYMHDKNIVHLDLKPENILLDHYDSRHIKIIDFGISRKYSTNSDIKGVYGTPEFIAPEILSYEPIGFGTDLWSLGCIAYTMLYGVSPFYEESKQDTYNRITGLDYNFEDEICDISNDARDFIQRLLVKDIRKRMTAKDCLQHHWMATPVNVLESKMLDVSSVWSDEGKDNSLNEAIQKRWKNAIRMIILYNRHLKRKNYKQTKYFSSRSLTRDGAIFNAHDENFLLAALFGAIEEGNLHSIQELFTASAIDPNQCNKHGESLLHYCAGLGQLEIFKYLCKLGADIHVIDDQGDTVVHWASRQNHSHIIRYIYGLTASIEMVNKNLETPLHVAARYGHVEAVEQMCKCGADINAIDEHGETAILIAVWHGFPKIVHILGEIGADTNIRNKEEETALHVASARGHYECVRCLLDAGANANLRNKNSYTPLHLALKRQHSTVAMLLLKAGADYELSDDGGERAVHYVARYNLVNICQWLCQVARSEVNVPNKQGLYPLHIAAKSGHIEIVRTLCLAGSVVDQKDKDSIIPQICAIAQSHNDIANLLTRLRNERQKEEFIAQLTPTNHPLQRVKLKIFGYSGSGKSTLIESLKCGYFSSWFRRSKVASTPTLKKAHTNGTNGTTNGHTTPDSNSIISTISNGNSFNHLYQHYETQTKGIDCQQVYISGVGDLSIWEFSGHPCYYQVYDHFIGDNDCLHAIVFRLSDPVEVQRENIFFWLHFIQSRIPITEPLLFCGKSNQHAKIILIATHADLATQSMSLEEIDLHLKDIMDKVNSRFRHVFDIHANIFMMDANVAGSVGMKQLKQYLQSTKQSMVQELPFATGFLDSVLTFLNLFRKVSSNFPILTYSQFKDMIRSQINPLSSEEHCKELVQQLEIMGEIIFLKANTANNYDLLVLNPKWLNCDIVGTLLLMKDDPNYMLGLNKTKIMGMYSIDEFQEKFTDVDALDLLQLLESLSICTANDHSGDIEYEFPCFILNGDLEEILDRFQYQDNCAYHGIMFHCEKSVPTGLLLTSQFPRLQANLRSELRQHPTYNVDDLHNCFKFSYFTVEENSLMVIFSVNSEHNAIDVRFCGSMDLRRECFFFMQEMITIVENTFSQCLPGLFVAKSYYSSEQLRIKRKSLSLYSSSTLMKSMLLCPAKSTATILKKKVKSDDGVAEEKIGDILCFGICDLTEINVTSGEPTLANELHSSNLSLLTKQKLCTLLDPPETIGRDWCMLGILLGMTDKLPKLDPGTNAPLSPTARVIEECVRNVNCTIKTLVEKLSELNRFDAIEIILQTGPLLRIFPLTSLPEEGVVYNDESSHTSLGVSTLSHTSSSNLSR